MYGNKSTFMDAVGRGDVETARRICRNEWIEEEDRDGWRPIHLACRNGHAAMVEMLLNRGCQIEATDNWGRRPIHFASGYGHADVVEVLLDHDCLKEETDTKWGRRPIHFACDYGHADVVQVLLDNGCRREGETTGGQRPMDVAIEYGRAAVVQVLLDNGCQMDAADEDGERLIHKVIRQGHSNILQMLFERGCDISARTKKGETALDLAKANGKSECARMIEETQTLSFAFATARQGDLKMFQHSLFPVWTKDPETEETLLDVIMQVNAKSIIEFVGRKPITDKDITDFLSLDRNTFSNQSYELLRQWLVHCCIRHNIDWAFMRLCNADMVNNGPLPDGTTCLDIAVENRRSLCVRHILHKFVESSDSWERARTVAMEKGYEDVVELIEQRQTALQRNTLIGRNRLHMAVGEGDLDMVEYLLQKGLVDHRGTNQDGDTPLMMAVSNGMDECANSMQKHGADVKVINEHGETVLHAAVVGRMNALPSWLIEDSPDLEQRDCIGLTALQQAVVADLKGVVAQLVALNGDHRSVIQLNSACRQLQNAIFKSFQSVPSEHLQLTSKENSSSLCLKLHGCIYPCFLDSFTTDDANFFDRNDNSLLHLTALLMDANGCKQLLLKGAVIGAVNKHKNTPLVELVSHLHQHHQRSNVIDDKAVMTVRCLIDGGADIADEHDSGSTALQLAIHLLDERLLLEMVRRNPPVHQMTSVEFEKCVKRGMFEFLGKVIPKLSEKMAQEYITADTIRRCSVEAQLSIVKICFSHSKREVQEEVIEEVLHDMACRDDVDYFSDILRMHRTNWKHMTNGESILTILIREKRWRFCELLLETETASKLLELTDAHGNSALMVAIEADAEELIDILIADMNSVDCENDAGDTALSMLLERVSSATVTNRIRLKTQIKHLINASANIYRMNRHNKMTIDFCTSKDLRNEFEAFHSKQTKQGQQSQGGSEAQASDEIIMCGVCLDRKVNRVLNCGHTLCSECANRVSECPFCRAQEINPRPLMLP